MNLVKTIKASKEVFIEVVMNSTCLFVKVSKKDLLNQIEANMRFNEKELYVAQQFGDAIYLTRRPITRDFDPENLSFFSGSNAMGT